jgi:hypothetical protein
VAQTLAGGAAAEPARGRQYNLGVSRRQINPSKPQTNPNKSKKKRLDWLGFIRPNRDFSMGYSGKNKKTLRSRSGCISNVSATSDPRMPLHSRLLIKKTKKYSTGSEI